MKIKIEEKTSHLKSIYVQLVLVKGPYKAISEGQLMNFMQVLILHKMKVL